MKTLFSSIFFLFLTSSFIVDNENIYHVGEVRQGGIIIHVDDTGEHGIVCSLKNLGFSIWSTGDFVETKAVDNELYYAKQNTNRIIEKQKESKTNSLISAAKMCYTFEVIEGGITYSDWYLPTIKELLLICKNKQIINESAKNSEGEIIENKYWSSTEFNKFGALVCDFNFSPYNICWDESQGKKDENIKVRAIRYF